MGGIFEFIGYVWSGIGASLRLDPRAFEVVASAPQSRWVVIAIMILGGVSLLVGQSVILFVNRVKPGRFVFSLVIGGIVFAISLLVWAVAIWFAVVLFTAHEPDLGVISRLVALSAAPYIFGFLILMPYLGKFVERILSVWSFVIVLAAFMTVFQTDFISAFLAAMAGWLVAHVVSITVGRPIIAARKWLFQKVTGSNLDAQVQDVLMKFLDDQPTNSPAKGKLL